jgi:multidrug efflux system membrane fusion protein
MRYRLLCTALGACLAAAALASGCTRGGPKVAPPEAPVVPVSRPVERRVTDYVDFTGQTQAVEAVDVRARVTGYLKHIYFTEGAVVELDQLLYEIDPRPYKAQLDNANSQIKLNQAQLDLALATLKRDVAAGPAAVPPQQLDQDRAAVEEAKARVDAAKASVEVYTLNLEFTKVKAPISGQVSRYYLTPGNLVAQDQTLLTTIVSQDPMYAYFDMDEATLLRIRRAISEGRIQRRRQQHLDSPGFVVGSAGLLASPPAAGPLVGAFALLWGAGEDISVLMQLQNEPGFTHQGTLNFVNNQVNPGTGSISVRAVFKNPPLKQGVRLLSPGMFVRIRFPIGRPHRARLVIDRALGSDQGLKFLYVLTDVKRDAKGRVVGGKVQQRRVTVGALQPDGLRVIEDTGKPGEGIGPDDWVIVGGVLQVRPGMTTPAEEVPMPTLGSAAEDAPVPAGKTRRQGDKETRRTGAKRRAGR